MKVLFAASECAPIIKVGGLADVVGSLPKAVVKLGIEAAVALPRYEKIQDDPDFLPGTKIPIFYLGEKQEYSGEVYPGGDQERERFANFCRQVVDFLETRQFEAEILHLHDYHTGLVPDIIRERKIRVATVLTIHDVQNVGRTDEGVLNEASLASARNPFLDWDLQDRDLGMLRQGVLGSDVVNTVSPTYAKEIFAKEVSGDLAQIFKAKEARVFGVLNGIDPDFFDPRSDKFLYQNYGPANFAAGKAANKEKLQGSLGLTVDRQSPLLAMVARLVERKGLALVIRVLPKLLKNSQLVILGQGDPALEKVLKGEALENSRAFAFVNSFDEELAHKIYAAGDFFLMPSKTEPCGLTQMIACRYGSLPIVHHTGGLADTVFEGVNGYVFDDFSAEALWSAATRAIDDYAKSEKREAMAGRAMSWDYSWDKSAKQYVALYRQALEYSFGIARGLGGEVREDYTGNWSLLSELRAQRPMDERVNTITGSSSSAQGRGKEAGLGHEVGLSNDDLTLTLGPDRYPFPNQDETGRCPFEFGREHLSQPEVFRLGPGEANTPGWQVRVVANKYPLVPAHEVVVYSPDHRKDLSDLPLDWVEKVVWTYLSRYRHYEDRGYVHIFCNHGEAAAASLVHPHSQIVVLDELPQATVNALRTAEDYYESHRRCPYCQTIRREVGDRLEDRPLEKDRPHFIWRNDSMALLTPYASDWPYELTILPLKHRQSFGNIEEKEMKDLAQILRLSLRLLKKRLGENLGYNFWIHSLPDLLGFAKSALYYHWHVDITPRLKVLGGVELGLGVMVDDLISPEKAAQELRQVAAEVDNS